MKSNKSKKSAKLKLNIKATPGLITPKKFVATKSHNQKLFLLAGGLFLISLSLLGLVGFGLGQKQSRLDQANTMAISQLNQSLESRVLGAVELAQNNPATPTEVVSTPQLATPDLIDLTKPNSESAYQGGVLAGVKQPAQPLKQAQTLENSSPKVDQKSNAASENQTTENSKIAQKPTLKLTPNPVEASKTAANFKNLTPKDFHTILLNHNFENTKSGGDLLSATGYLAADQRINQIAQGRGFQRWPEAIEDQLVELRPNIRLLPRASSAFLEMTQAAKKDKVIIFLNSGYRSQSDQNSIFEPRYKALELAELGGNYTVDELASGQGDELLSRIMTVTAPPGYSRHHTGYTVDLIDLSLDNTSQTFKNSKADKWLSQNNFANARRFGFIPSYPEGLDGVGPLPESWEYVWVGEAAR